MGKLNYTNRKISGSKLGSAVKKDVLKHSQTAAKSRSIKDLEVNLQGKELGDEGLEIACAGLCEGLGSGLLRLDELHLAENKITSKGLKFLGGVVKLASADLKDLDLRANELAIVTQEDAENWEWFLSSFKNVSCLRRLDLSENPIGDRGFEILWRVYSRAEPIYIPKYLKSAPFDGSDDGYDTDSMGGESDELDTMYEQTRTISLSLHSNGDSGVSSYSTLTKSEDNQLSVRPSANSLANSHTSFPELHGLRSVPYMVFSSTGITDSTALFLSYILPAHATPERLMKFFPAPKPGAPTETLESYYTLGCRGIIYRPNDKLSPLSTRVLDCAEALREGKPVTVLLPDPTPYKPGIKHYEAPFSPRRRRRSISFVLGGSNPASSIPDLERARSKIQGAILREAGPHGVALWSNALKVLVVAREIAFNPSAGPYEGHRRSFGRHSGGSFIQKIPHSPPTSPTHKFFGIAESSVDPISTAELEGSFPPLDLQPAAKVAHSPSANGAKEAATSELLGRLPETVWKKIVGMAVDPDGLLSNKQISNLVNWAKTRDTLEKERELSGKLRSLQIWRVLEGTECLAYDDEGF